jgi:hypothetical protein
MKTMRPWIIQRIVKNGRYFRAYVPDHPKANKHGYVLHHRIVVENKLGRMLTEGEVVHHLDNNGRNNDPDNLMVIATQSDHSSLHGSQKSRAFIDLVCGHCSKEFKREVRQVKAKKQFKYYCSRHCMGLAYLEKSNHRPLSLMAKTEVL